MCVGHGWAGGNNLLGAVAFKALSSIRGGARRGDSERYRQIVFFFFWGPEAPLFCNI